MKNIILFIIVLISLGLACNTVVLEPDQTLEYEYSSFVTYNERQDDGSFGPPNQRVNWDEVARAKHPFTAIAGGKKLNCPIAYQDVAEFYNEGEKHKVRILAYSGCPMKIKKLSIEKDIVLRKEIKLEIISTKGNILHLDTASSLPFVAASGRLILMCASAVNVLWNFQNEGMTFYTADYIYTTTKSDATIAFTSDGIIMNGVKKSERE